MTDDRPITAVVTVADTTRTFAAAGVSKPRLPGFLALHDAGHVADDGTVEDPQERCLVALENLVGLDGPADALSATLSGSAGAGPGPKSDTPAPAQTRSDADEERGVTVECPECGGHVASAVGDRDGECIDCGWSP